MVTDVDSAWGGFTADILINLRDEFLPKTTIFLWGLYNDETVNLTRRDELSRIRSTVELTQLSSLFIPISTPSLPVNFGFKFEKNSSWHVGAMQNIALESFSLLPTLSRSSYSMDYIADALSGGSNRNIVSSTIVAIEDSGIIDLTAPLFSSSKQTKSVHTFSKAGILRPPQSNNVGEDPQKISRKSALLWDRYFQSAFLQSDGTMERSLFELKCNIPYPTPNSYPNMIKPEDHTYSSLAVTTTPKKVFSDMTRFVSKFVRGDTREQLKNDTDELAREYEWSWESDEDSDYDY
ncbi:hypothetical protein NADFUDRAFT_82674 [Nadsonia fulvescens var. elongata DSM 6958]|uniref:DML1/Misato tubulin domain-containing protein n=1 Tax=Nadsonia fulvescens var. elongata DSM 6958 TaxID=857566 RepID=A0A1E3PKG7_9ASCO|nr:hypothetical protein NADFUDRAFT_82674 [Nadsonia fulvescens var. elongata DSM 6958]